MLRRAASLALLGVAAALIVYNAPLLDTEPRRAVLVLSLASVGVFLNFAGLLLPHVRLRPLLRGTGGAVILIVAIGFAAAAWRLAQEPIAPEAQADPAVVESLQAMVERFWWLAAAVAYVGVSLLLLPRVPRLTPGP